MKNNETFSTNKIKHSNVILTDDYQSVREDGKTCEIFNIYLDNFTKGLKLRQVDKIQSFKNKDEPTELRTLRAHVPCVPMRLAYLRARMPYVPKCSRAITSNNKNKFSVTCFAEIFETFSVFFLIKSIYDKQECVYGKIYFENSIVHFGISLTRRKPFTCAMTNFLQ